MMKRSTVSATASTLSIPLTEEEWAKLEFLASQRGLSPQALARSWIDAGFEFTGLGTGLSREPDGSGLAGLRMLVEEQGKRLRTLEAALGSRNGRDSIADDVPTRGASDGDNSRRGQGAESDRRARATLRGRRKVQRSTLHDEIVAVLAESGQPMRTRDIADVIRKRGRYQSPRSGKDINGAMVSSRVSNPMYRDLFRRADRKITLKG